MRFRFGDRYVSVNIPASSVEAVENDEALGRYDAIVGGKNFSEVLKGLAQDVLRIVTRKNITEPLANAFAGMDFGKMFSGIFANANGGVASSRMSYSRFLEYLDMGRVKKVDLFENGTIAIVEAEQLHALIGVDQAS
jgi:hypothetical protein